MPTWLGLERDWLSDERRLLFESVLAPRCLIIRVVCKSNLKQTPRVFYLWLGDELWARVAIPLLLLHTHTGAHRGTHTHTHSPLSHFYNFGLFLFFAKIREFFFTAGTRHTRTAQSPRRHTTCTHTHTGPLSRPLYTSRCRRTIKWDLEKKKHLTQIYTVEKKRQREWEWAEINGKRKKRKQKKTYWSMPFEVGPRRLLILFYYLTLSNISVSSSGGRQQWKRKMGKRSPSDNPTLRIIC